MTVHTSSQTTDVPHATMAPTSFLASSGSPPAHSSDDGEGQGGDEMLPLSTIIVAAVSAVIICSLVAFGIHWKRKLNVQSRTVAASVAPVHINPVFVQPPLVLAFEPVYAEVTDSTYEEPTVLNVEDDITSRPLKRFSAHGVQRCNAQAHGGASRERVLTLDSDAYVAFETQPRGQQATLDSEGYVSTSSFTSVHGGSSAA